MAITPMIYRFQFSFRRVLAKAFSMMIRQRRLVVLAFVALLSLTAFAIFNSQKGEVQQLSELLDLHRAIDRWREEPGSRAAQLPHICGLFRRHPRMLKRFGGEFLSSAILLRGELHKEGLEINHWFLDQQKKWGEKELSTFTNLTQMAGRGEYKAVASSDNFIENSDKTQPMKLSTINDLNAYQMIRRAACAYLSRDETLYVRQREMALKAAGIWPAEKNLVKKDRCLEPFAGIFSSYRVGRLSLLDWISSPIFSKN